MSVCRCGDNDIGSWPVTRKSPPCVSTAIGAWELCARAAYKSVPGYFPRYYKALVFDQRLRALVCAHPYRWWCVPGL